MAGIYNTGIGSKRGTGYDDSDMPPMKQSRDGRLTARLLLIGRYCGAIVGKGGETVKKIREKHSVQINGLNRHTEQRVLAVVGRRDNIISTLKEIVPTACAEAPFSALQEGKAGRPTQYTVNLLVPQGHIGAVIGKGGTKIREIMDSCESKVNIHQDFLPNSNERVVAIGCNSVDNVIKALGIVFDTLEALPQLDDVQFYEPNNDPTLNGGGGGGGAMINNNGQPPTNQQNMAPPQQNILGGGSGHMGLGQGTNQLINNNQLGLQLGGGNAQQQAAALTNTLNNMGVNAQTLLGQLSSVAGQGLGGLNALQAIGLGRQGFNIGGAAGGGIHGSGVQGGGVQGGGMQGGGMQGGGIQGGGIQGGGLPGGGNFNSQLQGMNRGPGGAGGMGGGNQMNTMMNNGPNSQGGAGFNDFNNQLDFLQVQSKLELTVTPEMCGAIIGKGGSTIKEVRATTGVKMTVAGNERGSKEDRTFTIIGTQQQIQQAEQMLTELVRGYRK